MKNVFIFSSKIIIFTSLKIAAYYIMDFVCFRSHRKPFDVLHLSERLHTMYANDEDGQFVIC